MWDLNTIISMNASRESAPYADAAYSGRFLHIFDLGNGKFALGKRGQKAVYVVRRVANRKDALGRGLPTYKGVQARRPRIPAEAKLVTRDNAGRLLLRALGLRN